MPFATLVPIALGLAQAAAKNNQQGRATQSQAVTNAFSPFTGRSDNRAIQEANPVASIATGLIGGLAGSREAAAQNLNNKFRQSQLALLQQQLGNGVGLGQNPGNILTGVPLGNGASFGNRV